jgi:CRP/FNR family transcriptional regulator, cyclic AMP receptor protein
MKPKNAKELNASEQLPPPDLFRDFSPEELTLVESMSTVKTFEKRRILYTPGETGEALFLLREGAVQIYRLSPEGRKLVIAHLLPYAFFGEMSCIGQGMYDAFAEATEDSLVITLNCADLERLLISKPQIALRILEAFGKRVIEAEQQLEDIAFKGLVARIASLLLREAEDDEVKGMAHRDIAERLGVYRETATNGLNELKAAGIIVIGRKRISITDRERLRQIAGE